MITVLENLRIQQLKFDLDRLRLNFYAKNPQTGKTYEKFAVPHLEEILRGEPAARATVQKMFGGDVAEKLFAAMIWHEIDRPHSNRIIGELLTDSSLIKVQTRVGHGFFRCPVNRLAKEFRDAETIQTSYLEKLEKLGKWQIAVEHEIRQRGEILDLTTLPTLEDVLAVAENPHEIKSFDAKINYLLKSGTAHKFYAAVLIKDFDDARAEQILETLKDDETPVFVLFGDVGSNIPAKEIAQEMLASGGIHQSFSGKMSRRKKNNSRPGFFQQISNLIFGK